MFVRKALAGQTITINGDGLQFRNYVYVEDLADAHVRCLADQGKDRRSTSRAANRSQCAGSPSPSPRSWVRSTWSSSKLGPAISVVEKSPRRGPPSCSAGGPRRLSTRGCAATSPGTSRAADRLRWPKPVSASQPARADSGPGQTVVERLNDRSFRSPAQQGRRLVDGRVAAHRVARPGRAFAQLEGSTRGDLEGRDEFADRRAGAGANVDRFESVSDYSVELLERLHMSAGDIPDMHKVPHR